MQARGLPSYLLPTPLLRPRRNRRSCQRVQHGQSTPSEKRGFRKSTWGSARVDSATILPVTVTRTLPSAGEIVMGWSGPGIRISLPLLVLVSIALFTVLVKALSRHRREYWHR